MFTKEELVAMGISESLATKVIESHKKTISNEYIPIHRFNEVYSELKTTKEQLKSYGEQIDKFNDIVKDNKELKEKVDGLNNDIKLNNEKYEKQIDSMKSEYAIKHELSNSGASGAKVLDVDILYSLLDLSKIVVKDGKVVSGLKEQVGEKKKEKPFLFEENNGAKKNYFRLKGKETEGGEERHDDGGSDDDISIEFAKNVAKGVSNISDKTKTVENIYFGKK